MIRYIHAIATTIIATTTITTITTIAIVVTIGLYWDFFQREVKDDKTLFPYTANEIHAKGIWIKRASLIIRAYAHK